MTPGELDQKIDFISETSTSDGMGGDVVTPATSVRSVWAKARTLSGREYERYGQINVSKMVVFIIRYRADVTEKMRISWNGATYNIRNIPPVTGRDMYMTIEAESGVAQ